MLEVRQRFDWAVAAAYGRVPLPPKMEADLAVRMDADGAEYGRLRLLLMLTFAHEYVERVREIRGRETAALAQRYVDEVLTDLHAAAAAHLDAVAHEITRTAERKAREQRELAAAVEFADEE